MPFSSPCPYLIAHLNPRAWLPGGPGLVFGPLRGTSPGECLVALPHQALYMSAMTLLHASLASRTCRQWVTRVDPLLLLRGQPWTGGPDASWYVVVVSSQQCTRNRVRFRI